MVGVKYIASVSFGKDSPAMLLRLLEENCPLDAVVFYNTGMEFDSIYRIRDRIKDILQEKGIEFVELQADEPFIHSMLERKIKYRNRGGYHYGYGWCGGSCRWGTTFKLWAIKKYKDSLGDKVIDYVGIAVDETSRFDKAKRDGKQLPLTTWGMSEKDCLEYCHKKDFYWLEHSSNTDVDLIDLYDILDRVSCWCCANKNLKELRNIYWHLPQYWNRLSDLQKSIETPMKGIGRSVFDLERRFLLEKEWLDAGKKINTKAFYKAVKC